MISVKSREVVETTIQEIIALLLDRCNASGIEINMDSKISDAGFTIDAVLQQVAEKFELSREIPIGQLNDFESTGNDVVDHLCQFFGLETQEEPAE